MRRAHPFTILQNLWRVLYLTIIPVLRGFLGALRGGFSGWLRGAWIDVLVMLLMIAIAVWRWRRVTYEPDDSGIRVRSGLIYYKDNHIPWNRVVTVSLNFPLLLKPFHAVRLRADTLGGSFKDADFTMLLSPAAAEAVISGQRETLHSREKRQYAPSTRSILALSLLTSNSFAGIVFISTFISQSGRLLGREFSDMLIGTMEEVTRFLAFGIPPAAAMIAYALLTGWLIAFLNTFVRYKNMLVERREHTLAISGGLLTQREYLIQAQDINFLDIRQSISTKLLNLRSLYISAVGYGKQKDDISCVIPTEQDKVFTKHQSALFPGFSPTPRQLAPTNSVVFRFIGFSLFLCGAILLAVALLIWRFPGWRSFILFVGLMLMVPAVILLIVRFLDFRSGGVSFDGELYTLRYSSGLYIHTVVVPANKIVMVQLRQSLLQKRGKTCDLLINTVAEGRFLHKCCGLKLEPLRDMFKLD